MIKRKIEIPKRLRTLAVLLAAMAALASVNAGEIATEKDGVAPAPEPGESFANPWREGKFNLNIRLRYEYADDEGRGGKGVTH